MRKRRKWEHCLLVWTFHTHFHSRISCSIKLVLASQAEGVSPNGRHWVLHNRREDGNAGLQQWTKLSKLRARYITCVLSGAVKGHGVNYLVTVCLRLLVRGSSAVTLAYSVCFYRISPSLSIYLSILSIYLYITITTTTTCSPSFIPFFLLSHALVSLTRFLSPNSYLSL